MHLAYGSRENAQAKARRYLLEGRVDDPIGWPAGCPGSCQRPGPCYSVGYEPGGGWTCTCPARTPRCCHVVAVQLVVAVPQRWEATRG